MSNFSDYAPIIWWLVSWVVPWFIGSIFTGRAAGGTVSGNFITFEDEREGVGGFLGMLFGVALQLLAAYAFIHPVLSHGSNS